MIRAISLWQPWASLLIEHDTEGLRLKAHETRGWRVPAYIIGQRVIVHASKTHKGYRDISDSLHELCLDVWGCGYNYVLPHGAAIGTAVIAACGIIPDVMSPASDDDRIAGNWASGRFAWRMDDPVKFAEPIPVKGMQGFWQPFELRGREAFA